MKKNIRAAVRRILGCALLVSAVFETSGFAAEQVAVVIGENAPRMDRYAAEELAAQFRRLFRDVEVNVTDHIPAGSKHIVLLGNPETSAAVRVAVRDTWPVLSDQGILIRSREFDGGQMLLVGGGSSVATMWAAFELGHRFGIRYLLREDTYPAAQKELDLSGFDIVMEPKLRTRTWRTVNDFAVGPESWGLAEHRKFLCQLARLKFNRVMFSVYPWQPFVSYSFGGIQKQTAVLWWGERFPVDGDTVGKKVFLGKKLFENPDFAGLTTPEEMTAAGQKHLSGLIDAAHEFGMTAGISISPLEFPREFQPVLPGSKTGHGLNQLTIVPSSAQAPDDETLRKLVATKISAYVQAYPKLDNIYLTLPEFPEWDQHADEALAILKAYGAPADLTVGKLVEAAAQRNLISSGARGEQAIRGNLVGLAFLHDLLSKNKDLLKRPDGTVLQLVITDIDSALYAALDGIVPAGAETLHFVDYTARRVAENRDLLTHVPSAKIRSQLIMTLADDNVGMLPQSALQSLDILTAELKTLGWDGISTRYWVPGELDPSVYFLSRTAWESDLTARECLTELFTTTTGKADVAERLWIAWERLEQATNIIDRNDIGFAFPVPGMLMKHFTPDEIPAWWNEVSDAYTEYMTELYRAHGAFEGGSKHLLFYYAKRGEYVLDYLGAVKSVREAAMARKQGDNEKMLEHLERAIEQTYNCINTLSDVAQDQSDRGLIAVLNAHAYRPLVAEYERLSEAE